ncbi:hypothetical protein GGS23DRAFT_545370 [Durotheca rogersii]|uniref:uncharacterized protein n=1 Tax=Durotheca rogersii TaxID=419775 RepID=UPI00221E7896|nr:uncharacterized protein GGS23DRAFT_545370 [Durotheca rogersii]KAI5868418.1 hypothetical protein GGS23DRAFT_545370 [Durotheca rogersii]
MAGPDSRKKLVDWRVMHHRGRNKILKASKNPAARAKLLAEIPLPGPQPPAVLHIPEADQRSAWAPLPAFLLDTPTLHSELPPNPSRPCHSFLASFPPEIRNAIYHYAVGYPTCRSLYDNYYDQEEKATAKAESRPRSHANVGRHAKVPLSTPTILLLCKQITREALGILHLQPFVIDRIPPWIMGNAAPLSLTDFISKPTLQNLRFVQVKISLGENTDFRSGKIWIKLLSDVLEAWSEHNCLVRLKIMFKLSNVTRPNIWFYELEDYEEIVERFSCFEFRHGLRPGLIQWEHWVLDFDCAYRVGFRNPLIRVHPDPYIWQGSVIEWL